MMPSRGMGIINKSKMPGGKTTSRRDDTDFTQYDKGGKVNAADNYMKQGEVAKSLKKAGFYDEGNSKAKRLSVINKVTTKPQRIEMVDKLFLTKKMAAGGELKKVPEDKTGLSKLPTEVRNKMGYMKEGGEAKSKVNEAGNYTKPELRKRIFNSVKAAAIAGTGAGQWSARKAQVMAKRYKAAGGGYKD